MARSHPPTLITLVRRTLLEECDLERGSRLLIGLSGGADSLALSHVLGRLSGPLSFELLAHGVDHGIREEADRELDLAARWCASWGIEFTRERVSVSPGPNLQSRARDARYRSLERQAASEHADFVVTAHHADDRAETVLLRLLRGSGARGLGVLPARSGARLRPMIRATRADVLTHLTRHDVEFVEDPSNLDPRFARVRVRHELLPFLRELSPGVVGHLTSLADELVSVPREGPIVDGSGAPVELNRAQRWELERARRLRRRVEVALSGGRQLLYEPREDRVTVRDEVAMPTEPEPSED